MLAENTHDEYRKYRKNNKCNKIPDQGRLIKQRSQEGPRNVGKYIAKIAKVTRIFLGAKNTRDKYRKNNKSNKIPDLVRKEAKKGPEISANIAIRLILQYFATVSNYK